MEIVAAAVEGARLRFRPILMTSFAFILGVFPLVVATGAGAGARRSIGLPVFSGMIASTCLVVVFVPSFYAVMQSLDERRTRRAARNEFAIQSAGGAVACFGSVIEERSPRNAHNDVGNPAFFAKP